MLAGLRTLALLGFALLGPASLPAGGAQVRVPEVRRRQQGGDPLMVPLSTALRSSPQRCAPVITQASAGEPLRLLRRWCSAGGQHWLQVERPPGPLESAGGARRGWVLESEP